METARWVGPFLSTESRSAVQSMTSKQGVTNSDRQFSRGRVRSPTLPLHFSHSMLSARKMKVTSWSSHLFLGLRVAWHVPPARIRISLPPLACRSVCLDVSWDRAGAARCRFEAAGWCVLSILPSRSPRLRLHVCACAFTGCSCVALERSRLGLVVGRAAFGIHRSIPAPHHPPRISSSSSVRSRAERTVGFGLDRG